jgi:hypothetical protein
MRRTHASFLHAGRCLALAALAAIPLLASPARAEGQLDRLKRAKEKVTSLPSVGSLFGEEPPITTTLDDARDEVPALDGFEPEVYSPLEEMPRGPGGYYLLAPGAYTLDAESFCIWPGTYGPREGNGYVYAELKGPKAELVSNIIGRSADHPDIDRRMVQELLWAVLSRSKPSDLPREMQTTAARLLTPKELADMEGYSLNVVPDAIGKRVLQKVPSPVRSVLEAENQMRRLFASPDTRFEDLERVAVLTGALPPGQRGEPLPEGRWSYHPNGYFIRYIPHTRSYYTTRIQVYYPVSVEIERDAEGRIVSVTTPDGGWVGVDYEDAGALSFAGSGADAVDSRLHAIRFAHGPGGSGAEPRTWPAGSGVRVPAPLWADVFLAAGAAGPAEPLDLARADLQDLILLDRVLEPELGRRQDPDASAATALLRGAVHTAVARYYRVRDVGSGDVQDALFRARSAVQDPAGTRYAIAAGPGDDGPARFQHPGRMMPIQPGKSGAFPSDIILQRLATSPRPDRPDALDMARNFTQALSNGSDGLGLATDPEGFFAGFLGGQIFGAGMDWDFKKAREISDAMQGATGSHDDAMLPASPPALEAAPEGPDAPNAVRTAALLLDPYPPVRRRPARAFQDYHTVARPRTVELPEIPTAAHVSSEHAAAVDRVLQGSFRLGALLEATRTTQERHARAIEARDSAWEYTQAEALVYLKRESGLAMAALADALDALRSAAGDAHGVPSDEATVRREQVRVASEGIPAEAVAVASAVGLGDDWARSRQARLSKLSPADVAAGAPDSLRSLVDALRSYGAWWASLPEVPRPWPEGP